MSNCFPQHKYYSLNFSNNVTNLFKFRSIISNRQRFLDSWRFSSWSGGSLGLEQLSQELPKQQIMSMNCKFLASAKSSLMEKKYQTQTFFFFFKLYIFPIIDNYILKIIPLPVTLLCVTQQLLNFSTEILSIF